MIKLNLSKDDIGGLCLIAVAVLALWFAWYPIYRWYAENGSMSDPERASLRLHLQIAMIALCIGVIAAVALASTAAWLLLAALYLAMHGLIERKRIRAAPRF